MRQILLLFSCIILSSAILGQEKMSDSFFLNQLQRFYLDTGTTLPFAKFYTTTGEEKTLSDFKGKIIYLDVWATWCPNCILKFPYQKQLRKRLQVAGLDTSILFININIDDTKKEWKNALTKYKPEGINLYSPDTLLYEKWNINALPAYLIIDKDGKVAGKKISQPDEAGTIDYILYSITNNVSPANAFLKQHEQSNLMAAQKTANAFTDPEYAKWFQLMSPYLFSDFLYWQEQNKKKKNIR